MCKNMYSSVFSRMYIVIQPFSHRININYLCSTLLNEKKETQTVVETRPHAATVLTSSHFNQI